MGPPVGAKKKTDGDWSGNGRQLVRKRMVAGAKKGPMRPLFGARRAEGKQLWALKLARKGPESPMAAIDREVY